MLVIRMPEGQGLDLSKGAPINAAQAAAREGTHALAMAGFVNWLAARYGELQSSIEQRRNQSGYAVSDRVRHNRTPAIYGNLMLALEEWLTYATEIGAVDEERRTALDERARRAVLAAIQAQGEYLGSADPVERYRDFLREALASGHAHLRAPDEEPGPGVHLGWTSPEGTFLYPNVALDLAKHRAAAVGEPLTISGQAMNQRLRDRGWLVATNPDKKRESPCARGGSRCCTSSPSSWRGSPESCQHCPDCHGDGRDGRDGRDSGGRPLRKE